MVLTHTWGGEHVCTCSLHPNGYSFISSGLDCCVKLWDLRNLGGSKGSARKSQSIPKPIAEYNGIKSINSAYFSSVTGQHVLTTTMHNRLEVLQDFHLTSSVSTTKSTTIRGKSGNQASQSLHKSFPHDNCTGRWLCTFMARWHPSIDDLFCVGSMEKPRNAHIYNTERRLRAIPGLSAVVSRCCFHPSTHELILVGGNSSGRVTLMREQPH